MGIQADIVSGDRQLDCTDDQRFQPIGGGPARRLEDQESGTLEDEEHRQGYDDVGHAGQDDEAAVEGAQRKAHDEHEGHDEQGVFLAGAVHQ